MSDVPHWELKFTSETPPEVAAHHLRPVLGFSVSDQIAAPDPYQAMHRWVAAVEHAGAIVFQSSAFALDEARGVSVFFDVLPVILVNAKDPIVARSFTLLHELGHLCLGSGALCDVYGRRLPKVETWCNRFSAAVLMREQAFLDDLGDLESSENLSRLARRFKVSEEAAAIRLFELHRLDRQTLDRIRAGTRQRLQAAEEDVGPSPIVPFHARRLPDLGRNYVGAVLDAYHSDRVTLTEDLAVSRRQGPAHLEDGGDPRSSSVSRARPRPLRPTRGEPTAPIKAICAACPVRGECLEDALASYEKFGMWDGKSERERRGIRQARRQVRAS